MSDGSGTINLASLANRSGEPAYFVIDDVGGYWSYQYNPCIPFTSGLFTDLAVRQSIIIRLLTNALFFNPLVV